MTAAPSEQQGAVNIARGLAGMLLGMGAAHFVVPKPFDAIVPAELPGGPRLYTHVSGIAEVATGALLLWPRTRRTAGLVAVALFLAVFPANVNCVRLFWTKPWLRAAMIARLPLQIPMIAAALRVWRAG
ncbi:membrane protein [Mycolicibacter heraklionensis]|uniref:Membrane protein n=1 Tax=Mycolicibacter heraklionensis TaxID=512402 RepID=A0ABR5FL83_9MYCO|nr:membrane protein [Mycolicibacter heraklionensis]KLO31711.1 membrane protein [Mycolicibacter heraklionensis]